MKKKRAVAIAALILWVTVSAPARAQEPPAAPFVADVVTKVVLDPTTYAPALVTYGAMRLDWGSSQVFFRNGYVEEHAGYTISGVSNSASISREAGNRRILGDAFGVFQLSLAHNIAARIVERGLTSRYPAHRKLLRVAWRLERIAAASYLSYAMSAVHFRQWQKNERMARELGFR